MSAIDANDTTRAAGPGRVPFRGRFGAVAVAIVALVVAGTIGAATHHDRHKGAATNGSAEDIADCPSKPAIPPAGGWGVGRTTITLVDSTRPTAADPPRGLAAKPDRTFPIVLTYPVAPAPDGNGGSSVADGATPAGRFPLVLFSHGVTSNGLTISNVTLPLVRAGYVVAAPTYPLSSGEGAGITDLPQQPADVHFMVDHLDAAVSQRLPGTDPVRAHCVAIAGHSLGAVTTLLAGYGACCRWTGPTAPKAVIELSGLLLPIRPGTFDQAPTTPLLLVHGNADKTVPYFGSQQAFSSLPGPRWFLTLLGGSHPGPFLPPYNKVVDQAMVAFLNAELQHQTAGLDSFGAVAQTSGVATWQHAG
jgi:fermentation-respiration switch protein FrsA (DUF1100 family)